MPKLEYKIDIGDAVGKFSESNRHFSSKPKGIIALFLVFIGGPYIDDVTPLGFCRLAHSQDHAPHDSSFYADEVAALLAPSHVRRALAKQRLLLGGDTAVEALRPLLTSDPLEMRMSAKELIDILEQEKLENSIASFLARKQLASTDCLPGWDVFSRAAGDTHDSRVLFSRLVRKHVHSLAWLDTLDQGDRGAGQAAYLEMDQHLPIDVSRINDGDPARWALLLMASSHDSLINAPILSSRVRGGLLNPQVASRLKESQHYSTIKRMIVAWLQATRQRYVNSTMLKISLVYQCDETAIDMSSQLLATSNSAPASIATALILQSRLEPTKARATLCHWLHDDRVCHVWQVAAVRHRAVQTEVRDVAMAMLLYLEGHDPRQFGFEDIEGDPETIFREFSMGFEDNGARQAAHQASRKILSQSLEIGEAATVD
jgi:hypothetical protein